MRAPLLPVLVLLSAVYTGEAVSGPTDPGVHFVANVPAQFDALGLRGDGLAFDVTGTPDPSTCKHYQGLARTWDLGTPYLFVTRSGNDPGAACVSDDDPGNLLVIRMGSRGTDGERMRSNRLWRDWNAHPSGGLWTKPPDPADKAVTVITFDGAGGRPHYGHPGGPQLVGNVLAVPMEKPFGNTSGHAVLFYDITAPESPRLVSRLATGSFPTSVLGLTPVRNPSGSGVRYLLFLTGGDNHSVRLFRSLSTTTDPNGATDLASPSLNWEIVGNTSKDSIEGCSGGAEWPEGNGAYQAFNFVREKSLDGALYAIGLRNTVAGGAGSDFLDLYRVNVDRYGKPDAACPLRLQVKRHVSSYPFGGHGDSANLAAAGGVHVTPSGELLVYGTEYENDGPFAMRADGTRGQRTVRFVEWRHIDLFRPDNPRLRPSVDVPASFTVDEGSTTTLAAVSYAPLQRAFVELFEDEGAGGSLPAAIVDDDDWLVVDHDDWTRDHFDDFVRLDVTTDAVNFDNNADSWRWFAPFGCTLRANLDRVSSASQVLSASRRKTLRWNGDPDSLVHVDRVLNDLRNDAGDDTMGDGITSVQFDPDCAKYYGARMDVAWDFGADGTDDAFVEQPAFNAMNLDGPGQVPFTVRASHPFDPSYLGRGDNIVSRIEVRNVSPRVGLFQVSDPTGYVLVAGDPMLPYQSYTIRAQFTDPGRTDRQTARLQMGDRASFSDASMDEYRDAFGGQTGELRKTYAWRAAIGATLKLTVTDDDGGATTLSRTARISTPADALQLVIVILQDASRVALGREKEILEAALLQLRGDTARRQIGAVGALQAGNLPLAAEKIGVAVRGLGVMRSAARLRAILRSLAATSQTMALDALADARTLASTFTAEQRQHFDAASAAIVDGRGKLIADDAAGAAEAFRSALVELAALG